MCRISLLVVLVSAAVVFGNTLPEEFQQGNGRIVGGNSARTRQFAFMASLRVFMNNRHICGVSILTMRWVLTAAHCADGRDPVGLRIVVGSHMQNTGEHHRVSRVVSHPTFDPVTSRGDIAVIQSASMMVFIPVIQPIALTEQNIDVAGGAMIFGWGSLSATGGHANALQWKVTDIISNEECQKLLFDVPDAPRITDEHICALSPVGGGVCNGDNGGPLVYAGQVTGVVSKWVGCGRGKPDVFTRVWPHRHWILNEIGE